MTDAFRCDGCDEYHDAEFQFLGIAMDTGIVDFVDFTLDDIPTDAYGILGNESGQGDLSGDFCPECGMAVLTDLVEQFRDDDGAVDDAETEDVEETVFPGTPDTVVSDTSDSSSLARTAPVDDRPDTESGHEAPVEPAPDSESGATASDDQDATSASDSAVLCEAEVKSYGLVLAGDVPGFFASDRVTVRERNGRYELAPGPSDDWPDYAVSEDKIQFGNPGVQVLDADVGTTVRATADGDLVILESDVDDVDAGDQEADASDAPQVEQEPADGADESPSWNDFSADGGTTDPECQNCGSHVDRQYVRVFEPEGEDAPRVCPNCPDLVRDRNGIRKKRN